MNTKILKSSEDMQLENIKIHHETAEEQKELNNLWTIELPKCSTCPIKLHTKESKSYGRCVHCRGRAMIIPNQDNYRAGDDMRIDFEITGRGVLDNGRL